jgi:hypothetical protein
VAWRVQKHLRNCSHCQGQLSEQNNVFGSYVVSEKGDSGIFLPERQDNETKLGARTPDIQGAVLIPSARVDLATARAAVAFFVCIDTVLLFSRLASLLLWRTLLQPRLP